MSHIMIDMESLGIGTKPVLLSLGAVKFTEDEITDRFHERIDPSSCQSVGLEITASTVMWWMGRDLQPARDALLAMPAIDLVFALARFERWTGIAEGGVISGLWGNGAAEGNVWLKSAYDAVGHKCPFDFRVNCCYRTLKKMFPDPALFPPDEAVAHDALSDAMWQAKHLQNILKANGLSLP